MNLKEIATIQERLKQLEVERSKLESRLAELQTICASGEAEPQTQGIVINLSGESEKIALFRSLFVGREDVFPKRWQNARTGKAGYAPACGMEQLFKELDIRVNLRDERCCSSTRREINQPASATSDNAYHAR